MDGTYPITLGGERIGSACVTRHGLYWNIQCCCRLSGEVVYKVLVCCENREVDLGILVPGKNGFLIETRVPVKRVGEGAFVFIAVPRHTRKKGNFVPIYPEEPFSYLDKLKKAYLEIRNNQVGVILP